MITLTGWEKGGVGKTNTAVQFAAMHAMAGKSVILVDGDKQCSASDWAATRGTASPDSAPVACSTRLGKSCGTDSVLYSRNYEHVIIDAGGRDSAELRFAMAIADLVVMPVCPGQYDAWALNSMVALKNDIEKKIERKVRVAMLINRCNPSTTEDRETREFLIENYSDDFELFDTVIYDRVVHRRSGRDGLSVIEDGSDQKAIIEMKNLYAEVFGEQWKKA